MNTMGIKSAQTPHTIGIKQHRAPHTMGIKTHMVFKNNNPSGIYTHEDTVQDNENLGQYEPILPKRDKKRKKSNLERN